MTKRKDQSSLDAVATSTNTRSQSLTQLTNFLLEETTAVEAATSVRARQKRNSIFNYVDLSDELVKKVQYGQEIQVAVQKNPSSTTSNTTRCTGSSISSSTATPPPSKYIDPLGPRITTGSRTPECPLSTSPIKVSLPNGISSIYRSLTSSSAIRPISRGSLSSSSSSGLGTPSKRPSTTSTKLQQQDMSTVARYGKLVRFQTDDGGFLLVDDDGSMWKAPRDFENDPRTHLVLLPSVTDTSNFMNRCIRSCDGTFICQRGDKLMASTRLVYADSHEIAPVAERIQQKAAAFLEEVLPHTIANSIGVGGGGSGGPPLQRQRLRPRLRRISAIIPEKPLEKPWQQYSVDKGMKLTPTNVWHVKCLNSPLNSNVISSALSSISSLPYLFHGMQVQLLQNDAVLLHERFRKQKKKFGLQVTSSSSSSSPTNNNSVNNSSTNRLKLSPTKSTASLISAGDDTASMYGGDDTGDSMRDKLNHVWLRPQEKDKEEGDGGHGHGEEFHHHYPDSFDKPITRTSHKIIWSGVWTIHVLDYEKAQLEKFLRESAPNQRPATSPCPPTTTTTTTTTTSSSSLSLSSSSLQNPSVEPLEEDEAMKEAKRKRKAAAWIILRFIVRIHQREKRRQALEFIASRSRMNARHQKLDPLTPLSTKEQLYLLQSYHPHIFGPRLFADDEIADGKNIRRKKKNNNQQQQSRTIHNPSSVVDEQEEQDIEGKQLLMHTIRDVKSIQAEKRRMNTMQTQLNQLTSNNLRVSTASPSKKTTTTTTSTSSNSTRSKNHRSSIEHQLLWQKQDKDMESHIRLLKRQAGGHTGPPRFSFGKKKNI